MRNLQEEEKEEESFVEKSFPIAASRRSFAETRRSRLFSFLLLRTTDLSGPVSFFPQTCARDLTLAKSINWDPLRGAERKEGKTFVSADRVWLRGVLTDGGRFFTGKSFLFRQ